MEVGGFLYKIGYILRGHQFSAFAYRNNYEYKLSRKEIQDSLRWLHSSALVKQSNELSTMDT